MPWSRLDDGFHEHPKTFAMSDKAFRLYVCSITYSSRHCLAGRLTPGHLAVLFRLTGARKREVEELVLLRAYEEDGGDYLIHGFGKWNPVSPDLHDKRAEAGRKGAEKRWQTDSKPMANAIENDGKTDDGKMANEWQRDPLPLPLPISPSHIPPNTEDCIAPAAPKERKKRAPFIEPTLEEIREYLTTLGEEHHADAMYDHYRTGGWTYGKAKKPIVDWQAAARTFVRIRHEYDAERIAAKRNGANSGAEQTLDDLVQEEREALNRIRVRREANL